VETSIKEEQEVILTTVTNEVNAKATGQKQTRTKLGHCFFALYSIRCWSNWVGL